MSQANTLPWWRQSSVWIMLLLGFSAGIPILLIFSSLSLWLREAGVSRSAVTFFSWAALGYSFKFVWAPLVDRLSIPLLTAWLGRRRAWLLLSQLAVIASILLMATTDPQISLTTMAVAAVLLGFSSATQDVVIDAFRIESADVKLQALLSSTYIAGYRLAMIAAGAGALYLAEYFGSSAEQYSFDAWSRSYMIMAGCMLIGIVTTLLVKEPAHQRSKAAETVSQQVRFLLMFALSVTSFVAVLMVVPSLGDVVSPALKVVFDFGFAAIKLSAAIAAAILTAKACNGLGLVDRAMVRQAYIQPAMDFFERYGRLALMVLLLVGFYRVSDIVMGVITNVFYQDLGYSKSDIASVTKVFGVIMTITGSFLGGFLSLRIGVMRTLMLGAILVAVTNLAFVWLSYQSATIANLTAVIVVDNLSQGIAIAAFIGWLSGLTNVSFTATQYALFSSLMTLFPKVIGGYSGSMVDAMGYPAFFTLASALGIPVIVLIYYLKDRLQVERRESEL